MSSYKKEIKQVLIVQLYLMCMFLLKLFHLIQRIWTHMTAVFIFLKTVLQNSFVDYANT